MREITCPSPFSSSSKRTPAGFPPRRPPTDPCSLFHFVAWLHNIKTFEPRQLINVLRLKKRKLFFVSQRERKSSLTYNLPNSICRAPTRYLHKLHARLSFVEQNNLFLHNIILDESKNNTYRFTLRRFSRSTGTCKIITWKSRASFSSISSIWSFRLKKLLKTELLRSTFLCFSDRFAYVLFPSCFGSSVSGSMSSACVIQSR